MQNSEIHITHNMQESSDMHCTDSIVYRQTGTLMTYSVLLLLSNGGRIHCIMLPKKKLYHCCRFIA